MCTELTAWWWQTLLERVTVEPISTGDRLYFLIPEIWPCGLFWPAECNLTDSVSLLSLASLGILLRPCKQA